MRLPKRYYGELYFMDIMMPVMDGLEAAQIIRQMDRPDAEAVPIIALSANAMDEDMKKTKMSGMDEHPSKPADRDDLLQTIVKYLKSYPAPQEVCQNNRQAFFGAFSRAIRLLAPCGLSGSSLTQRFPHINAKRRETTSGNFFCHAFLA